MSHPLVGETVGHYRIDALVGRGGMGEVFRAHDERLRRRVAVKALRHGQITDPEARRRFLREARMAGRVGHAFVASVFDVVERDDDIFLVMEYLEGRTLADTLRDGPLPTETTTRYALEMAEALSAIHRHGLVHRDFKPSNVILTDDGHIKVTDFGVALEVSPTTTALTASTGSTLQAVPEPMERAGTLLYMSPEQITGKRLDERSDLFSLGSVLWEMMTGEQAFRRATPEETQHAIQHDPPSQGREPSTVTSSPALRQVAHRLLNKQRERRYQKAEHVAEDLRAILRGDAISAFPVEPARRRRWSLAGLAAVVAVALGAIGWYAFREVPALERRPVVAVLPFEDRTGEPDSVRGEMLADLLASRISESEGLRAPDTERMRDALAGLGAVPSRADARDAVIRATHARWGVTGTLWREGDLLHAVVDAVQPEGGEKVGSFRVSAASTAVLADLASVRLLGLLAPEASTNGAGGDAAATDVGDPARELEFRARGATARYDYAEAIRLLEEALRVSPPFHRARLELAGLLFESGDARRAREEADRVRDALTASGAATAPDERWRLEAVDAGIREDSRREVEAWRALADARPDDPARVAALAAALARAGRFDEALTEIGRARELDPGDARLLLQRARALADLKRYAEAQEAIDAAAGEFEDLDSPAGAARVAMERGRLLYAQGRYGEAERAFRSAAESFRAAGLPTWAAAAEKNVADQEALQGRFAAAEARVRGTLPPLQTSGHQGLVIDALGNLGALLYQAGRFDEAELYLREAATLARQVTRPEIRYPVLVNLAGLLNYTGRVGEGRALAEEALAAAREAERDDGQEAALLHLADAAYQLGQLDDAERAYTDAIAMIEPHREASPNYTWARLGEVDVLRAKAQLGAALAAIDAGISAADPERDRAALGYCRSARGRLLGELGAPDEARSELGIAAAIAGGPGGVLLDLERRIALDRGIVDYFRRPGPEAAEALEAAGTASDAVGLESTALAYACSARSLGGPDAAAAAVPLCRRALDARHATAAERVIARAMLAAVLAAAGNAKQAQAEARRALDEAESLGMPLPSVIAAGVVASLPQRAVDRDTIVARGREALDRVLAGAPQDRRAAVAARWDVREWESRLAAAR